MKSPYTTYILVGPRTESGALQWFEFSHRGPHMRDVLVTYCTDAEYLDSVPPYAVNVNSGRVPGGWTIKFRPNYQQAILIDDARNVWNSLVNRGFVRGINHDSKVTY